MTLPYQASEKRKTGALILFPRLFLISLIFLKYRLKRDLLCYLIFRKTTRTRMHSSRMRTARFSGHLYCLFMDLRDVCFWSQGEHTPPAHTFRAHTPPCAPPFTTLIFTTPHFHNTLFHHTLFHHNPFTPFHHTLPFHHTHPLM